MALIVWKLISVASALLCTTIVAEKCEIFDQNSVAGQLDQLEQAAGTNMLNHCPTLIGDSSKQYCCYDINNRFSSYCCDALGMISNRITFAIAGIIMLMLLSCCCCFCCCRICRGRRKDGHVIVYNLPMGTAETGFSPNDNTTPYSRF